jgi:hypothetical protein
MKKALKIIKSAKTFRPKRSLLGLVDKRNSARAQINMAPWTIIKSRLTTGRLSKKRSPAGLAVAAVLDE